MEIKYRAWIYPEKKMVYDIQNTFEELCFDCFGDYLNDKDIRVMQFTGCYDEDGKEIWEGDLVSYHENKRMFVTKEAAGFVLESDKDLVIKDEWSDYSRWYGFGEIKGARDLPLIEILWNIDHSDLNLSPEEEILFYATKPDSITMRIPGMKVIANSFEE